MAAFCLALRHVCLSPRRRCSRLLSYSGVRMLLSKTNLGMDHYLRQRIFKTDELGSNGKEILLNRLHKTRSACEPASSVAFDINDFIHVANSERDLQELERHTRLMSSVAAVSTLRFGASLMRLFHHLNCPEQAYSIYKNDVCRDLLGDNTCHKILMDLLYNNQYYHQVLEVFDTLRHFNIDCATLAFGAHFHINTAGSAQSCILLLNKLHSHRLSQRALHFAAMLCLNQVGEWKDTAEEKDLKR